MPLPTSFATFMHNWLGMEWSDLEEALHQPAARGVRLHRVRHGAATGTAHANPLALAHAPHSIPPELADSLREPIPWSTDGYYIAADSRLGQHVYHEMGLYYLQEPSAMAAVAALNPQPGERVLDLCAAPGGKTGAIAARMAGSGLLAANEIHPARVVILAQNLERLGVSAVVTQESPDSLATCWAGQFDAVLVDAPCSGEGMFRKGDAAGAEWSTAAPEQCALRQRSILESAVQLVRPGGRVVYSTCTFNPIENEQVVEWALQTLPVQMETLPLWEGWSTARSDWTTRGTDLSGARRLWPHQGRGEGHFVCRLLRLDDAHVASTRLRVRRKTAERDNGRMPAAEQRAWAAQLESWVHGPTQGWLAPRLQGNVAMAQVEDLPLVGLRVLRHGICLGLRNHTKWEPHHHLAMSLAQKHAVAAVALVPEAAARYMAGETIAHDGARGWTWLHVDGLPVGWGKAVPGRVNNAYPKGLRKTGLLARHLPPATAGDGRIH